jgi:hypothetical protein
MSGVSYNYYSLDADGMMKQANQIMELIQHKAYEDGIISDPEEFSKRYSIVLAVPGTFSRWFDRVFMKNVEPKAARFVILENPKIVDEDEEQAHD